jgi:conjugative transfer pilus assembly protein TraH
MNGCGAINLTMGGFSYMNPQYLMQKLQGIMQMAPSFALEIAIKILSETAGNTMNFLEHISDLINSTNVSSCKAMSTIATSILPTSLSVKAGLEQANGASGQANGGSGWFGGITGAVSNAGSALSNWWADTAPPSGQALQNFTNENCPISVNGSMLDTAAADANFGSIPPDFIRFIRAYVGDVVPQPGSDINSNNGCDMSITYINGPEPVQGLIKGLSVGNETMSGSPGTLYEITTLNLMNGAGATATGFESLQGQVVTSLTEILNNLQPGSAGSPLSASDVQLINESNIPLYPFLKAAVLTGDPEEAQLILDNISKPVAMNIIFNLVSNYIHQAEVLMDMQKGQLKRGATPVASAGREQINKFIAALETMQKYIYIDYTQELNQSYKTVGNFTTQYSAIQQEVNAEFKKGGYGRYLTKFAGSAGI